MKRLLSTVATLLAVIISATLIVPLAACGGGSKTVKIANMAYNGLSGVQVTIKDGNKTLYKGKTNADGEIKADFGNGTYTVEFDESTLPKGYYTDKVYTIDGSKEENLVRLPSKVIEEDAPPSLTYGIGSIMYDFELTKVFSYKNRNTENNSLSPVSLKLSEVLKEKRAVLLNFWYTDCSWCLTEFPHMSEAYSQYSDDLAVLAIDNYPNDSDVKVGSFVMEYKYNFEMAMDSANVVAKFNISGYPTSFMIDRYGMVCETLGTTTDVETWTALFKKYTDANYDPGYINPDETETVFVPDKPADFGVEMSDPNEINTRINKTGTDIVFSTDISSWTWPWQLADDGESIYATNRGHRQTIGLIYARMNLEADKVFAFEYKFEGAKDTDYFRVSVDGRYGLGLETMFVQEGNGWTKGVAYIALEAGNHEISFGYGKQSNLAADLYGDTAYIKNLHFEEISDIADMDIDMPYFAAREQDPETGKFEYYSEVYKDSEGYYRVGSDKAPKADDPFLYVSLSTPSPYFQNYSSSIYSTYIRTNSCTFDGVNYYDVLNSYSMYAANSTVSLSATSGSVVPVRDDLKEALEALYYSENNPKDPHFSTNGWLELCSFFKHYGKGESYGNPILGLAPFSAFEAKETTGIPDSGALNVVTFDRLLMPRGYLFKFEAKTSGAYKFESIGDGVYTNAYLYDGSMTIAPYDYPALAVCGDDYYPRYIEDLETEYGEYALNFLMYYYLEAGKTYYLGVQYHNVEDLGTFKFRIDRIGDEFDYLSTVTGGFYTLIANDVYSIPVYADVKYNTVDDLYYDNDTGRPIYCDFTACSRMFNLYSIEQLLDDSNPNVPKGAFNLKGYSITINGKTLVGKDFTEIMRGYLNRAKAKTGELYGMIEVDSQLQEILQLFYAKAAGYDNENEWLKACWYYVHVGPKA